MAKQIQLRRGTTAQHATFTGLAGEVTVDTDKKVAVVHDGSTAGGVPLAKETRSIAAAGLATGGGDLSANRTITVTAATGAQAGAGTDNTTVITPLALLTARAMLLHISYGGL